MTKTLTPLADWLLRVVLFLGPAQRLRRIMA